MFSSVMEALVAVAGSPPLREAKSYLASYYPSQIGKLDPTVAEYVGWLGEITRSVGIAGGGYALYEAFHQDFADAIPLAVTSAVLYIGSEVATRLIRRARRQMLNDLERYAP